MGGPVLDETSTADTTSKETALHASELQSYFNGSLYFPASTVSLRIYTYI